MNGKPEYNYVSYCRTCGGWVMLCVDSPQNARWVGKRVGEAIKHGEVVKRVHDNDMQAEVWGVGGCICSADSPEQMELKL